MFRFTIRGLLWLTVVAGMGLAWWANADWPSPFAGTTTVSHWVVADAYASGQRDKDAIGDFVIFRNNQMYYVSEQRIEGPCPVRAKTKRNSIELTLASPTGLSGKGLLVSNGRGKMWFYLNVSDKQFGSIPQPGAAVDKAEQALMCVAIDADIAEAALRSAQRDVQ